jgi:uncharacterized damage-inducible protein DinB
MKTTIGQLFLKELEAEEPATRKCLERVPENLYKWKPHEKSMELGYLALLVADIPKWLSVSIEKGIIDLATWEKHPLTTTQDLLEYFNQNMEGAKNVFRQVTDTTLENEMFYLKMNGQELMKSSKLDTISSSINHWVHHRGQLTVYMRLNNIAVPSIYGPSADERTF